MTIWLFVILYGPAALPPAILSPRDYTTAFVEDFTEREACDRNRLALLAKEEERSGPIRMVGISAECFSVSVDGVPPR